MQGFISRMKLTWYLLVACTLCGIFAAGCMSTGPAEPTPVPTTLITPAPTAGPLADQALLGTWYLAAMTRPEGASPIQTMSVQMDVVFTEDGGLSGFSGCNHFSGQYILTGKMLPDGKGIQVGPLVSTLMYCKETGDLESQYHEILQDASSYEITGSQLVITSELGSTLVYHRTPYGPTAVPRGI